MFSARPTIAQHAVEVRFLPVAEVVMAKPLADSVAFVSRSDFLRKFI